MTTNRPGSSVTVRYLALAFVSAAKKGGLSAADLDALLEYSLAGILALDEAADDPTEPGRGLRAKESATLGEFREALVEFAKRDGVADLE